MARLRIAVAVSALVLALFAVAILLGASPQTRARDSASVSGERPDPTGLTPASSLIGSEIQLRILAPRHLGVASTVGSDHTSVIPAETAFAPLTGLLVHQGPPVTVTVAPSRSPPETPLS
jgi:hypothetical protein